MDTKQTECAISTCSGKIKVGDWKIGGQAFCSTKCFLKRMGERLNQNAKLEGKT
ncbi:hypothetical protein PA598K_01459 [Paenibacillus sp. 598K]|nr:hypothetical protein PA598K_01459 [Paenibacillus sp. 598K]